MDTEIRLHAPDLAGAHATANVPRFGPGDRAGDVRRLMARRSYDTAVDVAVCEGERLVGLVTMVRLLAAPDPVPLRRLMDASPPLVAPGVDQERAAWQMIQQGESSLAVVDDEGRFVGLIPPSRMLEVLLHEHAEDISRLGGVLHDVESARTASAEPVGRRLRHRLPWLLVGLAGAMLASGVVGVFEDDLERQVLLAFFVPGIVYMADAVGTQTETLVVRGLSVGVAVRLVARREAGTGLVLGSILAAVFFVFVVVAWGDVEVALAVSLALFVSCAVATVVALTLPLVFDRLGQDPAFGSGPLATVVQDLLSLAVYFTFVTLIVV